MRLVASLLVAFLIVGCALGFRWDGPVEITLHSGHVVRCDRLHTTAGPIGGFGCYPPESRVPLEIHWRDVRKLETL